MGFFGSIRRYFKRPTNSAGYVYYARLNTTDGPLYKIGYTAKETLEQRFAYGRPGQGSSIDRQLLFVFRNDAWDIEQTLLEHFDDRRAYGKFSSDPNKPLFQSGQSELFRVDVLGLDDDLYKPIERSWSPAEKAAIDEAKDGCFLVVVAMILAPFTLGLSLFFLLGGLSTLFKGGKVTPLVPLAPRRPQHPEHLQRLIDELKRGSDELTARMRHAKDSQPESRPK